MRFWFALVTSVMLMSLLSCEQEKSVEPTDDNQALGKWRLVQPAPGFSTTLTVEVDQYSGGTASGIYSLKLSGQAAINSYFASVRLLNWATGRVEVERFGTTLMGGSTEASHVEQTYYASLQAVNRYELTNKDRLRFYYNGGVLIYEKIN